VIINAAAYTAVDRAEADAETCWRANVDGPRYLAFAARDSAARLIHVSTDFIFDGAGSTPYLPGSTPRPIGVYGETKWRGELAVQEVLGERATILRTAWVYSSHGQNFVLTMLRLMREKRRVRVVADQVGTPTSARSVANALWELVRRSRLRGIHHWTDAGVASWYDFAVAIAEEGSRLGLVPTGVEVIPIATEDYPTAARRPAYSVLDKRVTTEALEICPVHWRENLRLTLQEIASG
jgi:dTDP-4-dehydrorhamnose reductase